MYAWEGSFQKQVEDLRAKEISIVKKIEYLNAVVSFLWTCAPFMVSTICVPCCFVDASLICFLQNMKFQIQGLEYHFSCLSVSEQF